MNAVEIEEAISQLAQDAFDPANFPFQFLEAFGNKKTTINRLKKKATNPSDVAGGVLQRNNIHMAVCVEGAVTQTLATLKVSPANKKAKPKFILATDGVSLEAEDLNTGETIACAFEEFPNHFGFFLPLAGISTVKQIRNNPIDIQATGRLNRLYVELLETNEDWSSEERRHDMNQFLTRLIFCFFAEDTDIFDGDDLFTKTVDQMSDPRAGNTHEVISELFRAMDTKPEDRDRANIPRWANSFPYVNGGLFTGNKEIPRFSNIARSYLLHAGSLDWKEINPDIFGSMIQAVADDDERGELGMHYTSVPNILKVLNPLFLDDLREKLEEAGDNKRKLLNLRKRLANIRVFDPACGSGNFLVISYIQLREIEAEILKRRKEPNERSWIKLENFFGIELKDFAVEVARLSLLIAEFQCDVRLIGQKEAKALVLPLKKTGNIVQGNALQLDWLKVCPPVTKQLFEEHDLAGPTGRLALEDGLNDGAVEAETYICGNPPYIGSSRQSKEQKKDLDELFENRTKSWKSLDYVAGWFLKGADYSKYTNSSYAFVSTNSICQGQQVAVLWPLIFDLGCKIKFAYSSFKWANLASNNAGVTVIIAGLSMNPKNPKIFEAEQDGKISSRTVDEINCYLIPATNLMIEKKANPIFGATPMHRGSGPVDGGFLFLSESEKYALITDHPEAISLIRFYSNSEEFINGKSRYCLWIDDENLSLANSIPEVKKRLDGVAESRLASSKRQTRELANTPHKFAEPRYYKSQQTLVVPRVSSENREYLPCGLLSGDAIVGDRNFALYDAPLWNMALIASRLHWVWIGTVCVRMRTDFSYSNTLGWNTFPVPRLTQKNKEDLTRCAEDILLAREAHFPKTIADLYDPENMPDNLRQAHERNDEVLERIYIGRRFKNDTERLEKLFELYTKMTSKGEKK